jgi:hypothetical protein
MNVYLDQLIKSVQAEIIEERKYAEQVQRSQRYPSKRTRSPLNRMLQRLATLETLRKAERRGATTRPNASRANVHRAQPITNASTTAQ